MKKKVDLVIIGAGSAGISAARNAIKNNLDYIIIDRGPIGTTCARVGCMPSKVLISTANSFYARKAFEERGISGAEQLTCDIPSVLRHVRKLRDRFAGGMVTVTKRLFGDRLIMGSAMILSPNQVGVGDDVYETDKIIIATGASPRYPRNWRERFGDRILTSDNFFEQEDLPSRIGVIGLGPIGLELGQALSRLGLDITGFSSSQFLGGLTDEKVNSAMRTVIENEFPVHLGVLTDIEAAGDSFRVFSDDLSVEVDGILLAAGTSPNLRGLGLENLGVPLSDLGKPDFNPSTMQIGDLPVFIAGDAGACRPILHEALDEGFIAGANAATDEPASFCRRTPLKITFSDPQIFVSGKSASQLGDIDYIVGTANFANQARALVDGTNRGLMNIYIETETGKLLGAEGACPGGEHFAHQLSWAIQHDAKVSDMLQCPFYHPVLEEALRSALREVASKLPATVQRQELSLCESTPESPVC